MLIDEWMPSFDVAERHETRIAAPREAVWTALRGMEVARPPLVRALFALRVLPMLLTGRGRSGAKKFAGGDLQSLGFVPLGERPGEEILLGVAGRFWRPSGGLLRVTAEELRGFDRPGFAVGTWNFTVDEQGGAVRLATETRVRCTDPASRRSFLRYWRIIGPFSGLIRRALLKSIRRSAEADAAGAVIRA
jgi:hypothetical protein